MTLSKDKAIETADKILTKLEDMDGDDVLVTSLSIIEAVMEIQGNKSFQESMALLHRTIKDRYLKRRA